MSKLDPVVLFRRLCADIPADLRRHVYVTGSLAAAYAYRVALQSQAVNTKDADLVVHPAGHVASAQEMAQRLMKIGWRRTPNCTPMQRPKPKAKLRAIRLMPPASDEYFIEFLNVPGEEQARPKEWIEVKLPDGWYGLPSFRFMGLTSHFRKRADEGLEYASAEMMALANLLSHRGLADAEIESGEFVGLRRCAKDLGRVLALAHLAGRDATDEWAPRWHEGLVKSFPRSWRKLCGQAGNGLRLMLEDEEVLEQAQKTTEAGLLSGLGVDAEALKAVGERLMVDAIEPLAGMGL